MVLTVKVRAGSSRQRIFLSKNGQVVLEVKSPAEHNRANVEVVTFFERQLGLARSTVYIRSGLTQPLKTLVIDCSLTQEEVYARLGLQKQSTLL